MKLTAAIVAFTVAASPAFAQQNNASDRVAMHIGKMLIQVEQQQDQIAALQEQLSKAMEKLKESGKSEEPEVLGRHGPEATAPSTKP